MSNSIPCHATLDIEFKIIERPSNTNQFIETMLEAEENHNDGGYYEEDLRTDSSIEENKQLNIHIGSLVSTIIKTRSRLI